MPLAQIQSVSSRYQDFLRVHFFYAFADLNAKELSSPQDCCQSSLFLLPSRARLGRNGEFATRGATMEVSNGFVRQIQASVNVDCLENAPLSPSPSSRARDAHVAKPFVEADELRSFSFQVVIHYLFLENGTLATVSSPAGGVRSSKPPHQIGLPISISSLTYMMNRV